MHHQFLRTTLVKHLASEIDRYKRGVAANAPYAQSALESIKRMQNLLPSGSGLDRGTIVDIDSSTKTKIALECSFHHMDDNGMYNGWTDHAITITPTFDRFDLRVTGRNKNGIKDYLHAAYSHCLAQEIDVYADDIVLTYWRERVKTANETDRFFNEFDPIYSGA